MPGRAVSIRRLRTSSVIIPRSSAMRRALGIAFLIFLKNSIPGPFIHLPVRASGEPAGMDQ